MDSIDELIQRKGVTAKHLASTFGWTESTITAIRKGNLAEGSANHRRAKILVRYLESLNTDLPHVIEHAKAL